jgi:uncharacterized membrane protein YedE/YeeE/rhodanese-related sulfurtransferase
MNALFPLVFGSEEAFLLSGLVIGGFFGFALERGGFANARKLAAQFYLYDMTVFKVMFTAIIVAMAGFYALAGLGWLDVSRMWINPTFMWAQVVGGFLLGVGFIMSGLCPGTSVVSAASGRWDGLVTIAGIFVGTAVFAVAVDVFPWLERLYESGGEVSILPTLFHLPAWVLVLGVVAMASGAFIGAEKVERIFQAKYGMIELTPEPTRRMPQTRLALGGTLAGVTLVSLAFTTARTPAPAVPMAVIAPLDVADAIIARDPMLVVFDLRADRAARGIPGARPLDDSTAAATLAEVPAGARVVVFDESGVRTATGTGWPTNLAYHYVRGGLAGWRAEVLTPVAAGFDLASRAAAERQRMVGAYFSGAGATAVPPPPAAAGAARPGGGGKKRSGGC